jgi:hypothetical protein
VRSDALLQDACDKKQALIFFAVPISANSECALNFFHCGKFQDGVLFEVSVVRATNRQSHFRPHYPDGANIENQRIKASGDTASGLCRGGTRLEPSPRGFFLKHEKDKHQKSRSSTDD